MLIKNADTIILPIGRGDLMTNVAPVRNGMATSPSLKMRHCCSCGAGKNSFSVSYDGIFRLCSSLSAPDMTYDLRRGTVREAWETVVPRVRAMRTDQQGSPTGVQVVRLRQSVPQLSCPCLPGDG